MLAFENTNAVARYAAAQTIVFGEDIDPDAAIKALDDVTYQEVAAVAAGVDDDLAVACVGPHTADDFSCRASSTSPSSGRYLGRIGDRWPLERAVLGGARVADARGAVPSASAGRSGS